MYGTFNRVYRVPILMFLYAYGILVSTVPQPQNLQSFPKYWYLHLTTQQQIGMLISKNIFILKKKLKTAQWNLKSSQYSMNMTILTFSKWQFIKLDT